MPQGLQVFDESKNILLDATTRITRLIGRVEGGSPPGISGSVTIPTDSIGNGNIFFIIDLLPGYGSNLAEMTYNKLTISGNTINYAGLVTGFYYGVY
ncbi:MULTISPECIES: hypothetical protein [Acinetobacter calcoaceticus/baumannii complex]|uniref:Uncharacterized protein n=8 Tax=Acinetobacter calcoaceticus/baumannii complex TaxID=909768 RepID=A0A0G3D3L6_ACIBA|nr:MULTISPECIES: hypothetical protein [Acinetobacter calcoaceticus/baumannii complex]AEP05440.1 hypothetical protein ABZJ_00980 [Acinetobacter baumannii MDR-ZJ06]AGQ05615.1 hypothetical protein BJAB0715_00969 [Acinetobacter baumannii BJAB0715]AGQ09541.1 hypothetical protein BJAB0868_00991 [Acinetobacter baumannii BJAB0868]AGQ13353.1 hypothetical protein BJAB07104_00985 [Acinetobacter baumannii BJAB07104]AKJ46788.1 hypothetical protein TE32_14720 [Acinetobacter baumannii]